MQENVTTKITNHHGARNPQSRGRTDVGCEMLLHNYWKAINASVGKCSSRAGLRWSWAPPPRNPNPALGLATRHRSWSRYALPRRDELTELLLFLFLPFVSIRESAVPLLVSTRVQDLSLSPLRCSWGWRGTEHHLALLHLPPCPAGSGCVRSPVAQRGALVRFSQQCMGRGWKLD